MTVVDGVVVPGTSWTVFGTGSAPARPGICSFSKSTACCTARVWDAALSPLGLCSTVSISVSSGKPNAW